MIIRLFKWKTKGGVTYLDCQPGRHHFQRSDHENGGEDDEEEVRDQREGVDVCQWVVWVVPLVAVWLVGAAAAAAVCGDDGGEEAREEEAAHGALDDDEPEDVDHARGDEARREVDLPRLVELRRREQDLQRAQRREPRQLVRGRDGAGTDVRDAVCAEGGPRTG